MAQLIEFVGTGGTMEGNFNDVPINVNLDAIYNFNPTGSQDDVLYVAHHADFHGLTAFTLSAWIYWRGGGGANIIVCKNATGDVAADRPFQLKVDSSTNFLNLQVGDDTDSEGVNSANEITQNAWNHVVATFSDSGNVGKLYINGVLDATDSSYNNTPNTAASGQKSVSIGANYNNDSAVNDHFDGYITDVRIYNTNLDASNTDDIKVLASKMNGDTNLLAAGTTNLRARWKLVNGSPNDEAAADKVGSAAQHNLTEVGSPADVYDAFSVNVQGDLSAFTSVTTDAAVTVTQGKMECLSQSCVDLNGSDEYFSAGDIASLDPTDGYLTLSAWIRPDNISAGARAIMAKRHATEESGNYHFGQNGDELQFYIWSASGTSQNVTTTTSPLAADTWHHVAVTMDDVANDVYFYVDGVEVGSDLSTITNNFADTNDPFYIGYSSQSSEYFDGKIRDARFYDQVLSAKQIASLYSGSFNVTPLHWWKLDEGYTDHTNPDLAGAFEDSGTGTDADMSGTNLDSDSCVNYKLDLDSTLTIAANGTLSAPKGTLDLADDFENHGTYTHNSGTMEMTGAWKTLNLVDSSAATTLHNLTITNDAQLADKSNPFIVENILSIASGKTFVIRSYPSGQNAVVLTMGKSTATTVAEGGSITGAGLIHFNNTTVASTVQGASQLYPCVVDSADWNWDGMTGAGDVRIANLDYDPDLTTGGSGTTVKLTGDCEFDAVTVTSGDTLDLNGQRMECSGVLTIASGGTIDFDGMVYAPNIISEGATANKSSGTAVLQPTSGVNLDLRDDATLGTLMVNAGSSRVDIAATHNAASATTLFVGSGILDLADKNASYTNMNIATGATLDADSSAITCAGDFTTSGGLLGASCLTLNGSDEYLTTTTNQDCTIANAWTIEGWMKRTSASGNEVILEMKLQGSNANRIWVNSDSDDIQVLLWNNTGASQVEIATVGQGLNDSKWHHFAMTYDGTTGQIYIDGKLAASKLLERTQDNTDLRTITIGKNVDAAENYFTGSIDEVRIFSDVRTESEIRSNMFKSGYANISGDALVAAWDFDEGTGNEAANKEDGSPNTALNLDLKDGSGAVTDLWAGAGTFTYGTSTLTMTGTDKLMCMRYLTDEHRRLYNLTVSGTVSFQSLGDPSGTYDILGPTCNISGTLTSISDTQLRLYGSSPTSNNITLSVGTAGTSVQNVKYLVAYAAGTVTLPACTTKNLFVNTGTALATGDLTITSELQVASGTTFNANGNTITTHAVDGNGSGTLDLSNSTLSLSLASGYTMILDSAFNITSNGNSQINGRSTTEHANCTIPSSGNFEFIGDVKWLKILETPANPNDLTVIGRVTNCSGAAIHQFHHNIDTQMMLDADERGDDDVKLPRPNLDNSTHLNTGG